MRPSRLLAACGTAAAVLAVTVIAPSPATAAAPRPDPGSGPPSDVRDVPLGTVYDLDPEIQASLDAEAEVAGVEAPSAGPSSLRSLSSVQAEVAAAGTPAVGTVRQWLAIDDFNGRLYRKTYTLRGVGDHIEVWVASDSDATSSGTAFPAGDCRNALPGSTDVTDEQVQGLVTEFDTNIYPKESATFSTAPDRDGSQALISGDYSGDGNKIVTLVDNVRDDNFYQFPERPTYIAGFFSSQFNELLDRNIMTIDAFDWLHRTGENPPDEPTDDLCTSRSARPFLYEGVFAHEYQHLLHYYSDPLETTWLNEALSDFAISLTGYADTLASVYEPRAESHLYCFNGFGNVRTPYNVNPRDCGGPQNSLTLWGDEGNGNEILADYGNAWSFALYLYDRYGADFISALHQDGERQGLASVQNQLDRLARPRDVYDIIHDFQLTNLVDSVADTSGSRVVGARRSAVTTASLDASLNLASPTSYAIPGAAPNGADYVLLRNANGSRIRGSRLKSLSFEGATTLPPLPLAWTVVTDAPGNEGNPTLWSGNASNLDAGAIVAVSVPTADPVLRYREKHLAEEGYDYAYTVVSTDGGATYTPLANANTVAGPLGAALNGDAAAFATQEFDLTAYAGQDILLGFRYVSDGGVNDGGWYVDDVTVGATPISDGSSLDPFDSPTEVKATAVANWNVRLVGIDPSRHRVYIREFDGQASFAARASLLARFAGYPSVVAVVSYDDPTEQVQQFAPYQLTVNGVLQPGG